MYLLLYIPVCLLALAVYEISKREKPGDIARRILRDFALLTGVFAGLSGLVFLIQRLL